MREGKLFSQLSCIDGAEKRRRQGHVHQRRRGRERFRSSGWFVHSAAKTALDETANSIVVLDLPQLYQRPSAEALLATLSDLRLTQLSWDVSNAHQAPSKRKINDQGVPAYLTKIVSSSLAWIEDEAQREQIWETASQRLSERSGRSGMGALTRVFQIPIQSNAVPDTDDNRFLEIKLHEPALTADNLGLKTWASSYLLAKRLTSIVDDLAAFTPDEQILELGAGTGLVGLAAAAVFQAHVVLTDLPHIVLNLEHNRLANETRILMRGGSTESAILDWNEPSLLYTQTSGPTRRSRNSFRLILAADPIYSSEHPRLFVQTIVNHLSRDRSARVVIELPLREAYAAEREDLKARMRAIGLGVLDEGEEVGYDDWSEDRDGEVLKEVRCWWSVWGWG